MSRPAGSDRAEEEYSSALFLSGAVAGRYSSDALPTGIVARAAAACRKSVGRRRRGKRLDAPERPEAAVFLLRAERYAGSETGGLLSGTVYRRVRIASAGDAGRRPSSPDGDKTPLFLADLPFVVCGRDRSGRDRMKSAVRDGGLPNAARYADAGRTLKKDGPAREPLNLTCRSYYCWLRMRIAASRIVVSSSVTTPPSGPCSTWMPTFPLAS